MIYKKSTTDRKEETIYDVVIIGGSYAGLSAAMTLGRAIRKVLIVDSGKPCNRQTPHSHNFLTQDGSTPAAIAAQAINQVMEYPTITYKKDEVLAVEGENNSFEITLAREETVKAKKVLFTTGIKDNTPAIKGFNDCWGISVIHCPYCHGYEYKNKRTAILANGDMAFEFGRLIHNWTKDLTIFTNGKSTITAANKQQLSANNIVIIEKELQEISHIDGHVNHVIFSDDTTHSIDVLYARVPFEQHCKIPQNRGCKLDQAGHLVVDATQQTSVPGIYAAGDNTTKMRSVSAAVAAGTLAGAMINHELMVENFQ